MICLLQVFIGGLIILEDDHFDGFFLMSNSYEKVARRCIGCSQSLM